MTKERTYVDIDDFGNTENIIKKIDPTYKDIPARMPGPVANFAQQQMSMVLRKNRDGEAQMGIKPFHRFLALTKGI